MNEIRRSGKSTFALGGFRYDAPTPVKPGKMSRFDHNGLREEHARRCRSRMICAECGRALLSARVADGVAELFCSNGHVTTARPKSRMYAMAQRMVGASGGMLAPPRDNETR